MSVRTESRCGVSRYMTMRSRIQRIATLPHPVRSVFLALLLTTVLCWLQQPRQADLLLPGDWVCPMHPDVHADKPGICPRCGMMLTLHVPERVERDSCTFFW